jgi:hypothetical protein
MTNLKPIPRNGKINDYRRWAKNNPIHRANFLHNPYQYMQEILLLMRNDGVFAKGTFLETISMENLIKAFENV